MTESLFKFLRRTPRMRRESGLALIEDAQRWQRAYCRERDRTAQVKEILLTGLAVKDGERGSVTSALAKLEDV